MKRILHLQHHTHTGKVLAHKHTSYRGLFVIVALFGIALTFIHQTVRADEIIVSAKVSAALPTQPAVILSPINQATVATNPIVVSGTCEYINPASIIELYSSNEFLGSGACTYDGEFSVSINLSPGTHQLIAKTVNITHDYGPDSQPVTITLSRLESTVDPGSPTGTTPSNQPSPSNNSSSTPDTNEPSDNLNGLSISSRDTYIIYGPAKDAEWSGYFEGGERPYKIVIDWGDGSRASYSGVTSELQSFRHIYKNYVSYFITVTVTDSEGRSLSWQFAAVTPYVTPTGAEDTSLIESIIRENQILTFLGYATILTLILLGVLTVLHAEYTPIVPPKAAKQFVPVKRQPRKVKR